MHGGDLPARKLRGFDGAMRGAKLFQGDLIALGGRPFQLCVDMLRRKRVDQIGDRGGLPLKWTRFWDRGAKLEVGRFL